MIGSTGVSTGLTCPAMVTGGGCDAPEHVAIGVDTSLYVPWRD